MQGFLVNNATTSVSWTVYFEDGTTLTGTLPDPNGSNSALVPPSTSTESWSNVTWVVFASGGGTVWMAGPASGINVPAVLIAAGPSATLGDVTNALGTPAASALALLVNQTSDTALWTLSFVTGPQSGSLSGNDTVSVTWTGVSWVAFTSDAGTQCMAGPLSGLSYAATLIEIPTGATIDDVLALMAGLPR